MISVTGRLLQFAALTCLLAAALPRPLRADDAPLFVPQWVDSRSHPSHKSA